MDILFALILILLGSYGYLKARTMALGTAKPKAIVRVTANLSDVSKHIAKMYNQLPAESRPEMNIISVLQGLDEKHAVDAVACKNHFNENYAATLKRERSYSSFEFSITKNCNHSRYTAYCPFKDYLDLYLSIKAVQDALDEKQRTMLASKHDVDTLRELEQALRQEAAMQRTFTKEFKELT